MWRSGVQLSDAQQARGQRIRGRSRQIWPEPPGQKGPDVVGFDAATKARIDPFGEGGVVGNMT
jgi:hypothetical protein